MTRWIFAGRSKTMPAAKAIIAPPAAIRIPRCRFRYPLTRSVTPRPARAKKKRGMATPTAKEIANATVSAPTLPVEPATLIAVSTGPAHGT